MAKKNDQKYQITIRNWGAHQRELSSKGARRNRRHWVAISVNLFSDSDYLELDATHSRLWLGLLLHAGKVGPVFNMSCSFARRLFDLRRTCDFHILKNQGFIDLQDPTDRQTDRGNETDRQTSPKKKPDIVSDMSKLKPKDNERIAELKAIYPKRSGSQPWSRAIKAINARIKNGAQWEEIADGIRRYAEFCRETEKVETEFVMMAATFCGPDEHFAQAWDLPQKKADRLTERNVGAAREFLEGDEN